MINTTRSMALVVVGMLASCAGSEFPDGDFHVLTLSRTSGLGFCPQADSLLFGKVARRADDRFELTGAIAAEGDPAIDECDPSAFQFDCLVAEQIEVTPLSDTQLAQLEERIAAVPRKDCDRDEGLACDPCLVTTISVDGHEASGYCCGDLNSDFTQAFDRLVQTIEQLRP